MANGNCGRCEVRLSSENACPSVVKKNVGYCRRCQYEVTKKYIEKYPEKHKWQSKINMRVTRARIKLRGLTLGSRHSILKKVLKMEEVPRTDFLWRINFYAALLDMKECFYCGGSLNGHGHGLDRIDAKKGHFCYNVVPCCKNCNFFKRQLSVSDFLNHVEKIHGHQKRLSGF